MDDFTNNKNSESGIPEASAFDNHSESFELRSTEDWQRLTPRFKYQISAREEKSDDIFFGGQMCE